MILISVVCILNENNSTVKVVYLASIIDATCIAMCAIFHLITTVCRA